MHHAASGVGAIAFHVEIAADQAGDERALLEAALAAVIVEAFELGIIEQHRDLDGLFLGHIASFSTVYVKVRTYPTCAYSYAQCSSSPQTTDFLPLWRAAFLHR